MMINHITTGISSEVEYIPETVNIVISAEQVSNFLYRFTDLTSLKNPSTRTWTSGTNVVGTGNSYETSGQQIAPNRVRYIITRVIHTAGSVYSKTVIWDRVKTLGGTWTFSVVSSGQIDQVDPATVPDGDTTSINPGAEILP